MKIPMFEKAPFIIEEFIPRNIFEMFAENSMWFIDIRNVEGMIFLRKYFDAPITLNNWHAGGNLQYRVFRPPYVKPKGGGTLSQHYRGIASDFNVKGLEPKEVGKRLIDDQKTIMENTFFTTIENPDHTPTWTHIDGRWHNSVELLIVGKPK